jgi:hypothetical protein
MNSDFITKDDIIINLNMDVMNLTSYDPRVQILAGVVNPLLDMAQLVNSKVYLPQVYTDLDQIDFQKITPNSEERKSMKVVEKGYEFTSYLKLVKYSIANYQKIKEQSVQRALSDALKKASINYDKDLLNGDGANTGVLTAGNSTSLPSVEISTTDILIKVLEEMKQWLSDNNFAVDGFKVLLPTSLKPMIESSLSFTVTGTERVFKSIGQQGVDFDYIPTFISNTSQIIMSYSPQVMQFLTATPQVIGSFSEKSGSIESYDTYEIGYGSTAIQSLNGEKAILVQPFTVPATK